MKLFCLFSWPFWLLHMYVLYVVQTTFTEVMCDNRSVCGDGNNTLNDNDKHKHDDRYDDNNRRDDTITLAGRQAWALFNHRRDDNHIRDESPAR
jgi:hypothetical protein